MSDDLAHWTFDDGAAVNIGPSAGVTSDGTLTTGSISRTPDRNTKVLYCGVVGVCMDFVDPNSMDCLQ